MKHQNFLFLFPVAVAILLAASCAKVQKLDSFRTLSDAPIAFMTSTHKTTKATMHVIDSAKNYVYTMTAYNAEQSGDVSLYVAPEDFGYGINPEFPIGWNTRTTHYWPQTTLGDDPSTQLSFFSWGPNTCDISFDLNGYRMVEDRTFPKLSVTVEDTYKEQRDMLAAMSEYETYAVAGATISYNHILSAIQFSAVAETDSIKYIVKEIRVGVARNDTTVGRLCPSGVYTYKRNNEKGTWDGHNGDKKSYKIGLAPEDTVKLATKNLTSDNGLLMLIPQELKDSAAYFSVLYDAYFKDNSICATDQIKYGCLFATSLKAWEPGVKYNYIISIPVELYLPLTYNVSVSNWTSQDVLITEGETLYAGDAPEGLDDSGGNFGKTNW